MAAIPAPALRSRLARLAPTAKAAPLVLATAIVFYMVNLREAHFANLLQLAAGWTCLAVLFVMYLIPATRKPPWRFLFLLVSLYLAMRYMWWRTFDTLIYTNPWDFLGMSVLFLAEVYSLVVHFLQLFVNFWPIDRDPVPLPADRATWPTVDIFIPTYTENEEIVRLTALAATQIDYPRNRMRIFILDDGATLARRNDPEKSEAAWRRRYKLKEIARELGVEYLTRESNRHAKAGNVNHAFGHSDGELVLFLDCDHVPTADILQETVGHFLEDEKLFLVQTPHFFCNAAPAERSLGGGGPVPDESEMFYRVIHKGLDFWNASYFCGSAAIMRRAHLAEIGGLRGASVTEDAETAFEMHRRGYHSRYVARPMVCGLAAEAYVDYVAQHTRWAQGSVQIMLLHNPLFASGLTFAQRLCYFNVCLFWFFGLARVVYLVAPAAFLIFGMSIYHASAVQILAYSLPHVAATFLITDFLFGRTRRPFFSEIYESIQSVFLTPAVLSTVRHPHRPAFKVTPKGISLQEEQLNVLSFFFFSILLLNAFAAAGGFVRIFAQPLYRDVVMVTLIWSLYNIYLSTVSLGALWEKRQSRKHHRLIVSGQAMVQFPRVRQRLAVDLLDLSLSGMSFVSPLDFEVKEKERLVVEAASADGLVSYFEAEVVRTTKRGEKTLCGLRFLVPAQSMPDVVHYVYGDSGRWLAVWEARSRGVALLRTLGQLLRMGVRGAWICLTIVLRIVWSWIRRRIYSRPRRAEANA
ncbi:MAG: UDP-forming cellulose synthase catalytic subunit [Betaproteobacteria bacterium]|nr:UDP-forming cellulose synthase catalytic subunit [Betaproteobacteria bacterium]